MTTELKSHSNLFEWETYYRQRGYGNGIVPIDNPDKLESKVCLAAYLPKQAWIEIASHLDPKDLLPLKLTCKKVKEFSADPLVSTKRTLRQLGPECETLKTLIDTIDSMDRSPAGEEKFKKDIAAFYQTVKASFPLDPSFSHGKRYSEIFNHLTTLKGKSKKIMYAAIRFEKLLRDDYAMMFFEAKKLNILNLKILISSRDTIIKTIKKFNFSIKPIEIEQKLLKTAFEVVVRPLDIQTECKTIVEKGGWTEQTWEDLKDDFYGEINETYGVSDETDELNFKAADLCVLHVMQTILILIEEKKFQPNTASSSLKKLFDERFSFLFYKFIEDFQADETFPEQFETTLNLMKIVHPDTTKTIVDFKNILFAGLNTNLYQGVFQNLIHTARAFQKELALTEKEFQAHIARKLIEEMKSKLKEKENKYRDEEAKINLDSYTQALNQAEAALAQCTPQTEEGRAELESKRADRSNAQNAKVLIESKLRYLGRMLKEIPHLIKSADRLTPEEYASRDTDFARKVDSARQKRIAYLNLINECLRTK